MRSTIFDLANSILSPLFNEQTDIKAGTDLEFEMPGMVKDSIKISIDGNKLNVSAKTKAGKDVSGTYWLSSFIDADKMTAKYEDGILYLNLKEAQKKKEIKVE